MTDSIIVTGGAGFIGSSLIRRLITRTDYTVVNVDKLTYAGNLESLEEVAADSRYRLEQVDICETEVFRNLLDEWEPVGVIHLAAESHVDRSIDGPAEFIETNVVGTFSLLRAALDYWSGLPEEVGSRFRFLHVSTDEVFGSLADEGAFTEDSPYRPSSPYSASKAAADHLVRAWHRTYGLPVCVTYCGNNYGPYQYPEKLIPLTIVRGLAGKTLPVYGEGSNVRNWIHVDDHVRALLSVFEEGESGATYAVGTGDELRNLEVVTRICDLLDELEGPLAGGPRRTLIRFVDDRPGHDYRYAIDSGRLRRELGWTPRVNLDAGLRATVEWYVNHAGWCERALGDSYRAERLGLTAVRP